MQTHVEQFLGRVWTREGPLLLALSGGPDSRALYEALCVLAIPFHVAHVDHGWRPESGKEAETLRQLSAENRIPFHFKKLEVPSRNPEDTARNARLAFFKELIEQHGFEGVLLAHHADDQAETVLKRVLEGASLPRLRGLQPLSYVDGIPLWRPLLSLPKTALLSYLHEKGVTPFADPTNTDPRYLRSRLRETLLPELEQTFGKGIRSSLCRIGQAAAELDAHLAPLLSHWRVQAQGGTLDFSQSPPASTFEWKAILRDFFSNQGISLPASVCETLIFHLERRNCHKTIVIGKMCVRCHRGNLTLFRKRAIDVEREDQVSSTERK